MHPPSSAQRRVNVPQGAPVPSHRACDPRDLGTQAEGGTCAGRLRARQPSGCGRCCPRPFLRPIDVSHPQPPPELVHSRAVRLRDSPETIATPTGQSIDAANLSRRFHVSLTATGLPDQRFHDLRHACVTLRLEQGETIDVVSRILGHASITTTANVYGHLTDSMLGKAAERTDVILGRRTAVSAECGYFCGYAPESDRPSDRSGGVFTIRSGGEPGRT
jgi:hypothetical protein